MCTGRKPECSHTRSVNVQINTLPTSHCAAAETKAAQEPLSQSRCWPRGQRHTRSPETTGEIRRSLQKWKTLKLLGLRKRGWEEAGRGPAVYMDYSQRCVAQHNSALCCRHTHTPSNLAFRAEQKINVKSSRLSCLPTATCDFITTSHSRAEPVTYAGS